MNEHKKPRGNKAKNDKDSILADAKNLLYILHPAIQRMPKIDRIEGAPVEMKRAVQNIIRHFDGVMVVPDRLKPYALSLLPELRNRLAAKGVKMNDKKFYCQQHWKGLEFLGSHIHSWSVILNDATWARCLARIEEYNQLPTVEKYSELDRFISTVNSYTGLLKNRTSYKRIMQLKATIGNDWWKWLEWDQRRLCVTSKPNYTFRQRLNKKYHLKLKNYETRRNPATH